MEGGQADVILRILEKLKPVDRAAVQSFAEFLLQRSGKEVVEDEPQAVEPAPVPEPRVIPRPDDEKVVAAVKRLSSAYYMLDKARMLGVTSELVTQHIVEGRDRVEVIDELERLFESHYRELKQSRG
ncbi:MAG: hypothetical protein PVG38_08910 [Gammaproteobacteria bacterium]|jgi:hypothetical protein